MSIQRRRVRGSGRRRRAGIAPRSVVSLVQVLVSGPPVPPPGPDLLTGFDGVLLTGFDSQMLTGVSDGPSD